MRLATIYDIETTGKLHKDHRIIEASFRLINLDTYEEVGHTLMRFNPKRNIDAKALAVHGIPLEELKGEPDISECLPKIKSILEKSTIVVAHNGRDFDNKFLELEFERNGIEFPEFEFFDTMLEGNFATDLGKSPSLAELCWSLDVPYDPALAHSGNYDTACLAACFINGIKNGWFKL